MVHAIYSEDRTGAPALGHEWLLVVEVQSPNVRAIQILLEPRTLRELLHARIPEAVEIVNVVRGAEAVVQNDRFYSAITFQLLQHAQPDVERMTELFDVGAACIQQIDTINCIEPRPQHAAAYRQSLAHLLADHAKRKRVAL